MERVQSVQMSEPSNRTTPITLLLERARDADREALDELYAAVYPVLRRMAASRLGGGSGRTVTPTVVVNELYLKLEGGSAFDSRDRHHFYATCSKAMRFIITDFARASLAKKRGGKLSRQTLTDATVSLPDRAADIIELDAALDDLETVDSRLRQLVELKFFGGLNHREIGRLQDLSERTVKRDWVRARAFLVARSAPATG